MHKKNIFWKKLINNVQDTFIKTDNLEEGIKDNDGGFIKVEGQKVGFLANVDEPFSPDGYYTEGPYYQRYAMYPFLWAQFAYRKPKYRQIFGKV